MKTNPFKKISQRARSKAAGSARRVETKRPVLRKEKFASKKDEQLYDREGNLNPTGYDFDSDVKEASETAFSRNANRMFNDAGQINAIDNKDALIQARHLLNNVARRNASFLKQDYDQTSMSKEARKKILAAALGDPSGQGLKMVAQELAEPIKFILDYEGLARKLFRIRRLGQGELFRIQKDVRSVAYIIGADGQTPEAVIKAKWILPEEYKVTSFTEIDIQDIKQSQFDILDRAQDTARQEVELQEDKAAVNMIDVASQAFNTVTTYATLGIGALEDVRYQVERHRLMVERFVINRQELSDVIKTMSTAVDPVTERELLLAGYIGRILNADIITTAGLASEELIPAGTFYAMVGPDYLGELGIRLDLETDTYDKYAINETKKGIVFLEMIGYGLPNAKAVAKGTK